MSRRFVPARLQGGKKEKKKKDVNQWILRAVTIPAASHQSREKYFRPQDIAGHCQARPGMLAALQPHTQKRKDLSFWQTSHGQGASRPVSEHWEGGKAAPWRKVGPRGISRSLAMERFNPPSVAFVESRRDSECAQAGTKTYQSFKSWLARADEAHFYQSLPFKGLYTVTSEQAATYLIICSMVPNQRHNCNCTIPRHLDKGTYQISHGGVAVSITLMQQCGQCCPTALFNIPYTKSYASSWKKIQEPACVVLPICFSSAGKCNWC